MRPLHTFAPLRPQNSWLGCWLGNRRCSSVSCATSSSMRAPRTWASCPRFTAHKKLLISRTARCKGAGVAATRSGAPYLEKNGLAFSTSNDTFYGQRHVSCVYYASFIIGCTCHCATSTWKHFNHRPMYSILFSDTFKKEVNVSTYVNKIYTF